MLYIDGLNDIARQYLSDVIINPDLLQDGYNLAKTHCAPPGAYGDQLEIVEDQPVGVDSMDIAYPGSSTETEDDDLPGTACLAFD